MQLYFVLLAAVAMLRLVEIRISRRNQQRLLANGVKKIAEPQFRWMVWFHVGILIAAGSEILLLRRPFYASLSIPMLTAFLLATGLRWWVIHVLSDHWNIQVMRSSNLGVVTDGPFRWVRHPNYAAVYVELIVLPLIHSGWITALVGAVIHWKILRRRIRLEESVLMASAEYRETMGWKPRFLPGIFSIHSPSFKDHLQDKG